MSDKVMRWVMEDAEPIAPWRKRIVEEACERNGVPTARLFKNPRRVVRAVSRARAQAIRILIERMTLQEAGRAVGLTDHSSASHWITGRGKDRHK